MHSFSFSAKPQINHFFLPLFFALIFLTACGGESAYIDRGHVPIANAGKDQKVASGTLVTLDGSKSTDDDGDTLAYYWILLEKPINSNVSINNDNTMMPSFVPDVDGTYVL